MATRIRRTDRGWKDIERNLRRLEGARVSVGIHAGAGTTEDGTSVAMIAAVHEFGAPAQRIPERSFLRSTMTARRSEYTRLLARIAHAAVVRGVDLHRLLATFGLRVVSDVQDRIQDGIAPALAPLTVAKREAKLAGRGGQAANDRFTGWTPLIDTGQNLLGRLTAVVGTREGLGVGDGEGSV